MNSALFRGLCAAAVAAGMAATPAQAAERLQLDSRGPDVTTAPLQSGADYYVQVSGTVSIWPRSQWTAKGTLCGAAESGPMYPSPGVANGPVGWDAETDFAVAPGVPFHGFTCVPSDIPFHLTEQTRGGLLFDGSHVEPLGGPFSVPQADHTYVYRVTGTGAPLTLRFGDTPKTDNYGVLKIAVFSAAEWDPAQTAPPAPAAAAKDTVGVLAVSAKHRCASRRYIRIHLRAPKGVHLRSAVVRYGGRTISLKGRKLRTAVDLRGLPKGAFKVRITMVTTRGQTLKATRTFRTCAPRRG